MNVSTPGSLRHSIVDEVNQMSGMIGGETTLSEKEIDDLVQVLMQVPEDARETQARGMINDLVQQRLGDPRTNP